MIELIGKSDDDPPIFALRVSGVGPAQELDSWLRNSDNDVRRVEVQLESAKDLGDKEIRELSRAHGVRIEVMEDGTDEALAST